MDLRHSAKYPEMSLNFLTFNSSSDSGGLVILNVRC